jgi:hypothetical protein
MLGKNPLLAVNIWPPYPERTKLPWPLLIIIFCYDLEFGWLEPEVCCWLLLIGVMLMLLLSWGF